MDNFSFDMTCEGAPRLLLAMKILFCDKHPEAKFPKRATHYRIDERLGLIFYDYSFDLSQNKTVSAPDLTKLPFKLDAEAAADFVTRWLAEAPYGKEPDHDGGNHKGWRVYTGSWGRPDENDRHSFVAAQPAWATYGK